MRVVRPLTAVMLLTIYASSPAFPEGASALIDRSILTTSRLIEQVRTEIFENTIIGQEPSYLSAEREIEVRISREIRPGAEASIDNGRKIINFNAGNILILLIYIDYATIRMERSKDINEKCSYYIDYIGEKYKSIAFGETPEDFFDKFQMPANYCGVVVDFNQDPLKSTRDKIMIQTVIPVIALMLGHEIGHHLLGHLPPKKLSPQKAREVEAEADRFGSVLSGSSISRAPAAVIFTLLASLRKSHPFNPYRRHDTAECRFIYFLKDDQRILGEEMGAYILNQLKPRFDMSEQIARAIKLISPDNTEEFKSRCSILK